MRILITVYIYIHNICYNWTDYILHVIQIFLWSVNWHVQKICLYEKESQALVISNVRGVSSLRQRTRACATYDVGRHKSLQNSVSKYLLKISHTDQSRRVSEFSAYRFRAIIPSTPAQARRRRLGKGVARERAVIRYDDGCSRRVVTIE